MQVYVINAVELAGWPAGNLAGWQAGRPASLPACLLGELTGWREGRLAERLAVPGGADVSLDTMNSVLMGCATIFMIEPR